MKFIRLVSGGCSGTTNPKTGEKTYGKFEFLCSDMTTHDTFDEAREYVDKVNKEIFIKNLTDFINHIIVDPYGEENWD